MHDKLMRAHDAALIKRVQATMALLTRLPTLPKVAPLADRPWQAARLPSRLGN